MTTEAKRKARGRALAASMGYPNGWPGADPRAEAAEAQLHRGGWEPMLRAPGSPLAERVAMARAMWRAFRVIPVDRHAERGAAYAAFVKAEEYACLEVSAMCRDCDVDPPGKR